MQVFCFNIGGLRTKITDLVKSILCSQYDILIFVESWLSNDISDSELSVDSFNLFRCDRSTDTSTKIRGGGLLIYIRDNINSKRLKVEYNSVEQLFLLCSFGNNVFIIGGVYIPPKSESGQYDKHCHSVEILRQEHANCGFYIFGDFNIPEATWDNDDDGVTVACNHNSPALTLGQSYAALNFFQSIAIPNTRNVFLDLIFTNNSNLIVTEAIDCLFDRSQNHIPYSFEISFAELPQPSIKYEDFYYDFGSSDYSAINDCLCSIDWNMVLSSPDINVAVSQFYHILNMAIALFVPLKRFRTSQFPKWFSGELRYLITQKKIAHKRYCTTRNVNDYAAFSYLRSRCKILADICYQQYITNLDQLLNRDPKSFWQHLNSKRAVNNIPNTMYLNDNVFVGTDQIADGFATFFSTVYNPNKSSSYTGTSQLGDNWNIPNPKLSIGIVYDKISKLKPKLSSGPDGIPNCFLINCVCALSYPLCVLFQRSLDTAEFPVAWKHSFVVPIFKSGDNNKIENYRSVCTQSAIPKLLDGLIYDQIYFYSKELILGQQHGFCSGRSTLTNLLIFQQDLLDALERGCQMDVIYTDFSKAFDRVDHGILPIKLRLFGFSDHMVHWFINSLTDLTQQVRLGNARSQIINVCSGVPQGGHCSPLLFLAFINDIATCFRYCHFLLFADDLKFYRTVLTPDDQWLLQSDLNRLYDWCVNNNLFLNINKCNFISFHKRFKKVESSYVIERTPLQYCDTIKDLGIYFDDQLSFGPHISDLVVRSSKVLGFVMRNCRELSVDTCKRVYMALVVSLLEYGSMIWSPYYMNSCLALERVQNKFIRFCLYKLNIRIPEDHVYDNALEVLDMQSLRQRRVFGDLVFIFKLLNGQIACPELLSRINFNIPSRVLRKNRLFSLPFHSTNYAAHSPIERALDIINGYEVDIVGIGWATFKRNIKGII